MEDGPHCWSVKEPLDLEASRGRRLTLFSSTPDQPEILVQEECPSFVSQPWAVKVDGPAMGCRAGACRPKSHGANLVADPGSLLQSVRVGFE